MTRNRLIAAMQQQIDREPPPPVERLFFLNTLPRLPDVKYVILSYGIIEADKIIMA